MHARTADGRESAPSARVLEGKLGASNALWTKLHGDLATAFGPLDETWSYTKKTARWSVQLKQRRTRRAIVYLVPLDGHFEAAFALGEKACAAARSSGIAPAVLEVIERAPRYVEGRAVRLDVRDVDDVRQVEQVAAIKMALH